MSSSKFVKGMMIGALIGGAITLLDKDTRRDLAQKSKKVGANVKKSLSNPKETIQKVQMRAEHFRQIYHEMNDDIRFIAEKAVELKEAGEEAAKLVEETKNEFKNKQNQKELNQMIID